MSTIEAIIGKPLHECTQEELQDFVQSRRRDITAIQESDVFSGGGSSRKKAASPKLKAEIEDAL